jgi:hypothetical protein
MSTNTIVEQPSNVVVIDEENLTVEVQETSFDVVLADAGVQGPSGATGAQGPAGAAGASHSTYVHNQNVPASFWDITHNLASYPSVSVIDSTGGLVVGDISYVSNNRLTITFSGAFSGQAYLN